MKKTNDKNKEIQFQQLALETAAKLEDLISIVDEMVKSNPDYYGGLQVKVFTENSTESFYMVSDLFVNDPFIEFYHLLPVDPELLSSLSLKSFPEKSEKQGLQAYVKKVNKDKRWNRIHEQFLIPNIIRIQTFGCFMYSKFWDPNDNKPKIILEKGTVVPFKKK